MKYLIKYLTHFCIYTFCNILKVLTCYVVNILILAYIYELYRYGFEIWFCDKLLH